MRKMILIPLIVFIVPFIFGTAFAQDATSPAGMKPTEGWALHIDAKRHIPNMPDVVVHHYCKKVSEELTECQLYDSDRADAKLIGVEMVVGPATYNKFSKQEKALWHYHKVEIPKVDAKLPDLSAEEAAKTLTSMNETYGKVYILWNPAKTQAPEGKPGISVLK